MIGALGTTLFFAFNAIFANRSAKRLGSNRANLARLTLAVLILGVWAHLAGQGLHGASVGWFFLSGLAGFGLGGVAMFQALPRLGSPLAMLIVQCGSSVVAVAIEWSWLGTQLTVPQLVFAAVTVLGVALGLSPRSLPGVSPVMLRAGIAWAIVSAGGQGLGAVLSRKAFKIAATAHEFPDAATTAYQRALAGLVVAALVVAIGYIVSQRASGGRLEERSSSGRRPCLPWPRSSRQAQRPAATRSRLPQPESGDTGAQGSLSFDAAREPGRAWPWVLANALCGPVLGVTCFQWALSTTPAGIVQPIVATAPLVTIPLAMWLEHARPRALYYVGTLLAVIGVIGLFFAR